MTLLPLQTNDVEIDADCIGENWFVSDINQLARIVSIVAMGQATQASHIINELLPATPKFTSEKLVHAAKVTLTVQDDYEDKKVPRIGYPRWQRDGFIFEVISWVAARQKHGPSVLLKTPHTKATSQGLDGLMLKISDDKKKVLMTTIFEDKCTDEPRNTFLQKVMAAFQQHHDDVRLPELISEASRLLSQLGIDEDLVGQISEAVLDHSKRSYRASFALTEGYTGQTEQQKLFAGYNKLTGLTSAQRIGAGLFVSGGLRDWFDTLASHSIVYLTELEEAAA